MRRMCAWCGEVWEASRLEPPEDEPYLCPCCQGKKAVLMKLREGAGNESERTVPDDSRSVTNEKQI